jgi:hypothetical protein
MDQDEYDDYLVDKAKELLHESADDDTDAEIAANDNRRKRRNADRAVADSTEDATDVKQDADRMQAEVDMLARRRQHMDNDELEEFLSGESEVHELMREADDTAFSDWENRMLITHPDASPDDLAEQLDRSVAEIKLQQHRLGLDQ